MEGTSSERCTCAALATSSAARAAAPCGRRTRLSRVSCFGERKLGTHCGDCGSGGGDDAVSGRERCTGEPPGAYGERLEKELPTAGKFGIAALEKQRAKREQHAFAAEAAAAAALAATDPNTLGVAAPEAMDADAPPASNGARKRGRPGKQRTPTDDAPDGKRSRVSPGDAVDAQALVPKLQPHSPPVVSSPARAPVLAQPAIPNAAVLAQPMAPVLAQPPNLPPVGYPGHPGADPMLLQTLAALGVPQHAPKAPFV